MGDQHFLDKISEKELIEFFHSNKNMISAIKDPKMFIRELRDNDLIPDLIYKKIDSKLGEGKRPDGIYGFLSRFEKNSKQHIRKFWRCTFREHICVKYPPIRSLRNKLYKATISNIQIDKKIKMEGGTETNPNRAVKTDGIKAEQVEQPQLHKMGDQLQLLENLSEDDLIQFFRSNKKMISSIGEPVMLIRELQDNDLIPDPIYNMIDTKLGEDEGPDGIYVFLSWFETNSKQHVRKFWRCMFSKHICEKYPSILSLRNELLKAKTPNTQVNIKIKMERGMETKAENTDGIKPGPSYTFPQRQAEPAEQPQLPDSSVTKINPTEKNATMKMMEKNKGNDNMASGSSSSSTKKKTAPAKSSKLSDNELLVTCDGKKGILHLDKLLEGIKCIKSTTPRGRWYLPSEFMTFAGRKKNNNWKTAIRHNNIPLLKLIEDGSLNRANKPKRGSNKQRKMKKSKV